MFAFSERNGYWRDYEITKSKRLEYIFLPTYTVRSDRGILSSHDRLADQ